MCLVDWKGFIWWRITFIVREDIAYVQKMPLFIIAIDIESLFMLQPLLWHETSDFNVICMYMIPASRCYLFCEGRITAYLTNVGSNWVRQDFLPVMQYLIKNRKDPLNLSNDGLQVYQQNITLCRKLIILLLHTGKYYEILKLNATALTV
jgi:hypothetical protein